MMKGRAIAACCSEKVKACLISGFTPLICMLLLLLLHQFTKAITGAWMFRLFELALCILGIVVSFRTHTSWLKVVTVGVLAISLCTSSVHVMRDISGKATPVTLKREASVSEPDYPLTRRSNNYYGYSDSGYNTEWSAPATNSKSEKVVCHVCNGSRFCKECAGSGRISIQKQGINLGGGGSTYNEYKTCSLCGGDKKCHWCRGTGYEPFS